MKTKFQRPKWWPNRLGQYLTPSGRRNHVRFENLDNVSLTTSRAHEMVENWVADGKNFSLIRPGGTESEGVRQFLSKRLDGSEKARYSRWYRDYSELYSGITWTTEGDLDYFAATYLREMLSADLIAYGRFAPGTSTFALAAAFAGVPVVESYRLLPFQALDEGVKPWTLALENKRVLVVHPFSSTITEQFSNRTNVKSLDKFLPQFSLQVLKPPITFAGSRSPLSWREHFDELKFQISKLEFDIALTSGGSYGLPVSTYISRELRKSAVHLGGALQLLFGVRGKRFEKVPRLSKFMDDTWVRPSQSEIPPSASKIEGGAYW